MQHHFNGRVALVEGVRYQAAVTVEAEGQLGHVVRADGEAVEVLQELFCQYSVAWQLAHHDQAQAVFAAFQTVFFQSFNNSFCFTQSTNEWNHDFDVGQAHFIANAFQGFALECEAVFEVIGYITRCTTEAQHWVFFVRFVDAATHQVSVLVGFEVRHTDDGFAWINRSSQSCHTFCDFIDIEVDRRSVAGDAAGNFRLQFIVLFIEF